MSRKPVLLNAALALLAAAAIGWALLARRAPPPGEPVRGFTVRAGRLELVPSPAGEAGTTSLEARGAVELARAGAQVSLESGSIVDLPAEAAAGPPPLPAPRRGRMVVALDGPVLLDKRALLPRGRARLAVTPESLEVLEGGLLVGGTLVRAGTILPWRSERGARPASTPEPGAESIPPGEPPPPTGQVVDARTGEPLPGVEVDATFSHSDDGYPPLPGAGSRRRATTDRAGRFRIEPFLPEDPRLKLHLEVAPPDFLPLVQVVEGQDTRGRWPFTVLNLRRALTTRLLFLDPQGRPLRGAAVEVWDAPPDPFVGEDTWEGGQTYRAGRPLIRYTGEDGTLRLWQQSVRLTLRDPLLHLWDVKPARLLRNPQLEHLLPLPMPGISVDLRPDAQPGTPGDPRGEILTMDAPVREYLVQDRKGDPIAESLIEVSLEEMPDIRVYTDGRGVFSFAPRPHSALEKGPPLSPQNPRTGTLTVLSALFWKRSAPVSLPTVASALVISSEPAAELALRLREASGADRSVPVPADGIKLSQDLTLTRRGPRGDVLCAGAVPRAGTTLVIGLHDYLPQAIRVPPHLATDRFLDLGEIYLERGGVLTFRLSGGTAAVHARASIHVADREWPQLSQEYHFNRQGLAIAGGFALGRSYLYAVDGASIERVEGEVLATPDLLRDGLSVPLVSYEEEDTVLEGQVVGVSAEQALHYRVVERYFPPDETEPLTFASYPLPPDGVIGSRRLLPVARRAEVFVVGPGFRTGYALRERPADGPPYRLGRLQPRDAPHAIFTFRVEGLGAGFPPPRVTLVADQARNHEVARLRTEGRELIVENLRPGGYLLRWGGKEEGGGGEEIFAFRVRSADLEVRSEVPRRARASELVELELVDPEGQPVEGAEFQGHGGAGNSRTGTPSPGGRYLLEVHPREENRFRVKAEGFLPLSIVLPAGGLVPGRISLRRSARVEALVRDTNGRPLEEVLLIRFGEVAAGDEADAEGGTAPDPAAPRPALIHGEDLDVRVEKGLFSSARFPSGTVRATFRLQDSEARLERVLELSEKRLNKLGTLSLAENRTLAGVVLLPGGGPAAGAVVGLVRKGTGPRFPLRAVDVSAIQFSTRADALGGFRIDGLPLEIGGDLELAARLPGYSDAVESPLDLSLAEHVLELTLGTRLAIDVGYGIDREHPQFEFRLGYRAGDGGEALDLGPLPTTPPGGQVHEGITPGIYRVTWDLRERHPGIAPRWSEAAVAPGRPVTLGLRVNEQFIPGEAYLNGVALDRGWILLLLDPSKPSNLEVGRVRSGRFEVPVPPGTESALATLLPEREPLWPPDFFRGEGLPQELRDFRPMMRRKFLSVSYRAHDFTLLLGPGFLERNPDLEIEFPHHIWAQGGYRKDLRREPLTRSPFVLHHLPEGHFSLRVSGRGGSRLVQSIDIREDTTITLGN